MPSMTSNFLMHQGPMTRWRFHRAATKPAPTKTLVNQQLTAVHPQELEVVPQDLDIE